MIKTALENIERIRAQYWAADERRDFRERDRLGRSLTKAEDEEMALPALSDADAAAKLRTAVAELALSDSDKAGVEVARLQRLIRGIGAPDSPRHRFELHIHLQELQLCAFRLSFIDLERGMLDRVRPHLEAAITWLGRTGVEHCTAEGVTIYYVCEGVVIVTRAGEPVSAKLSALPARRKPAGERVRRTPLGTSSPRKRMRGLRTTTGGPAGGNGWSARTFPASAASDGDLADCGLAPGVVPWRQP